MERDPDERVNVAEALGAALSRLGVEHFFGLVGSGNLEVTNALRTNGARFYPARHECVAVGMADGYARTSGRVGVATVHQGPGLTNAMTAVTEAAKARTPLLLVAADTSAAAVLSNFRVDQAGLAGAVGAGSARVHTPASAINDLVRAWREARDGRHTVVLNLPLDVQGAEFPAPVAVPEPLTFVPPSPAPGPVHAVADLIEKSERPVILGGRGAVLSGAGASLEELGERIGAPLVTSANGNGLFSASPWCAGISGGFASPAAAELMGRADLLLSFGASLNMWTTRHGTLVGPATRVVQVDLESAAIGVHRRVDEAIVGDASLVVGALNEELGRRSYSAPGRRGPELSHRLAAGRWTEQAYEDASSNDLIDPRTLSIALDRMLPRERVVAVDSGHFMGWPAMYLSVPDARGFVFTQSYQAVGLGLGSAMGAAIANPGRVTVACLGDGGALMTAGDLETMVRLGLDMVVVIYNDSAYGAEVHHFGPSGHPLDTVRFPDTDFAALAEGLGARGLTVRRAADLEALASWLEERDKPLVVDAKVAPFVVAEWLEEAFRAH